MTLVKRVQRNNAGEKDEIRPLHESCREYGKASDLNKNERPAQLEKTDYNSKLGLMQSKQTDSKQKS